MKNPIVVLALVMLLPASVGAASNAGAERPRPAPLAGWFGAWPALDGYIRSFSYPAFGRSQTVYAQTVTYTWSGGADRAIQATLARDAAFHGTYAPAVLQSLAIPPRPLHIEGYHAWLWDARALIGDRSGVKARLVVVLGPDRVLTLSERGLGPLDDLSRIAARFNPRRAGSALSHPPRKDFQPVAGAFRVLRRGDAFADVQAWVGEPDRDIGSGIHIFVYALRSGDTVWLGFPDLQSLLYAQLKHKDGTVEHIVP